MIFYHGRQGARSKSVWTASRANLREHKDPHGGNVGGDILNGFKTYWQGGCLFFILILGIYLGWNVKGCSTPQVTPQVPDTLYVNRYITVRDTIPYAVPETHIVYDTKIDTVEVCHQQPANFTATGLIPRAAIRIERYKVYHTYFDFASSHIVQDIYTVRPPPFSVWLDIAVDHSPLHNQVSTRANVRYKGAQGFVGYGIMGDDTHGLVFGVRVRVLKII